MARKNIPVKPVVKATTQRKPPKHKAKQLEGSPLTPLPQDSIRGSHTRSQTPSPIDNTAVNGTNGENTATSSNHNDPSEINPALPPVTPRPNHVATRASNADQHPGQRHNIYDAKRRTKEQMLEVRRAQAQEKAKKVEEAERRATQHKKSMERVAQYEEDLAMLNTDSTPIAHAGRRELSHDANAAPILQGRELQRSYAMLDVASADVAPNGGEDDDDAEEPAFVQESEATNQNDGDYIEEDEEDEETEEDERMLSTADVGVKVIAKAGEKRKKDQRRMIVETEVPDSEADEEPRPKKKTKGSKGSAAAKSLIPRDEVLERAPGETTDLKQNDEKKGKKKEKRGVLLRDAVNAIRSEVQERNLSAAGGASVARADLDKHEKLKQYICSHLPNFAIMLTLSQPTLYYWNLRSNTKKDNGIITNWATTISKLSSSSQPSAGSSRTLSGRVSTQATSITSKSVTKKATNILALSDKSDNDTDAESKGAFSDNDETVGKERDAAVNSPPKNGVRATSSVSTNLSLVYYTYAKLQYIGYRESRRRATSKNAEGPTTWKKWPEARSHQQRSA